jgi:carboxymethylenebutenolidase
VLLPNLYYRAGRDTIFGAGVMEEGNPERTRMRAVRTKMTIPPVMHDIAAMLAFIDRQDAVMLGPVGCHGYCMSGPYALAAAARYPDRIAATASFYGTWLISEAEESPHRSLSHVNGELSRAGAEHDALAPLPMVEALQGLCTQAGVAGEIERYPGVHHGFAFPQRWCDDKPAAERHWERLLALYRRQLTALPSGGQRSGHAHSARVAEQGDEYLARWTMEPRVLITVTPERITTRAAGNRYARVTSEVTSPPPT